MLYLLFPFWSWVVERVYTPQLLALVHFIHAQSKLSLLYFCCFVLYYFITFYCMVFYFPFSSGLFPFTPLIPIYSYSLYLNMLWNPHGTLSNMKYCWVTCVLIYRYNIYIEIILFYNFFILNTNVLRYFHTSSMFLSCCFLLLKSIPLTLLYLSILHVMLNFETHDYSLL